MAIIYRIDGGQILGQNSGSYLVECRHGLIPVCVLHGNLRTTFSNTSGPSFMYYTFIPCGRNGIIRSCAIFLSSASFSTFSGFLYSRKTTRSLSRFLLRWSGSHWKRLLRWKHSRHSSYLVPIRRGSSLRGPSMRILPGTVRYFLLTEYRCQAQIHMKRYTVEQRHPLRNTPNIRL